MFALELAGWRAGGTQEAADLGGGDGGSVVGLEGEIEAEPVGVRIVDLDFWGDENVGRGKLLDLRGKPDLPGFRERFQGAGKEGLDVFNLKPSGGKGGAAESGEAGGRCGFRRCVGGDDRAAFEAGKLCLGI